MTPNPTERAEQQFSCVCEFSLYCNGRSQLHCRGCGEDFLCRCACGGETDCLGCKYCDAHEGDWNEDGGGE